LLSWCMGPAPRCSASRGIDSAFRLTG
jgi:hypothetical protein